MSILESVVSFRLGWLIVSLVVVLGASLLVLWISTFLAPRWVVTIRKSEETELLNVYLSRIAESLERLAGTPGTHIDLAEEHSPDTPELSSAPEGSAAKSASMSIFGI